MTTETSLNPEGEAAWLRVKQHLEWFDGFSLVFLFNDRPGVIDLLRERLAAVYRAARHRPQDPAAEDTGRSC